MKLIDGEPVRQNGGCRRGLKVLVVEDEAVVALVLALALTAASHDVLGPVASVDEALRLADADPPRLALIDIHLAKGGDGVWLARALRQRWRVPSLFLSGRTAQARAAQDAALGLIGKPYDPAEVVEAVDSLSELIAGRWPERLPTRLELFRRRTDDPMIVI